MPKEENKREKKSKLEREEQEIKIIRKIEPELKEVKREEEVEEETGEEVGGEAGEESVFSSGGEAFAPLLRPNLEGKVEDERIGREEERGEEEKKEKKRKMYESIERMSSEMAFRPRESIEEGTERVRALKPEFEMPSESERIEKYMIKPKEKKLFEKHGEEFERREERKYKGLKEFEEE